jgi:hypothetical protein
MQKTAVDMRNSLKSGKIEYRMVPRAFRKVSKIRCHPRNARDMLAHVRYMARAVPNKVAKLKEGVKTFEERGLLAIVAPCLRLSPRDR